VLSQSRALCCSNVILRCEADDAFASLASLEGWLHALRRTTSFEARKGSHLTGERTAFVPGMTPEIASRALTCAKVRWVRIVDCGPSAASAVSNSGNAHRAAW
jgi:hypothetical protein